MDLSPDVLGVGIGVTLLSVHWSQLSSSTSLHTLTWELAGDSQSVPVCYVVYGVGGVSTETESTADLIGVYAYDPTESNGQYSCPLPT